MLALNFVQKKKIVENLRVLCEKSYFIAIASYSFGKSRIITQLRVDCFSLGITFKVVKNKLILKSLYGTKFEALGYCLSGFTVFVFLNNGYDIREFFKKTKKFLKFKKFFFEDKIFDCSFENFFSKLPTKVELYIKLFKILIKLIERFMKLLKFLFLKFIKVIFLYKALKIKGIR